MKRCARCEQCACDKVPEPPRTQDVVNMASRQVIAVVAICRELLPMGSPAKERRARFEPATCGCGALVLTEAIPVCYDCALQELRLP